jgi:hypothetical protein
MKNVYIAGPMSGVDQWNYPAFFAAEARLRELGYNPINPAHNDGLTIEEALASAGTPEAPTHSWAHYMKRDLPNVIEADALCVLPGWRASKGASLEVTVAKSLGIPVMCLTAEGLVPRIQVIGVSGYARSGKDTVAGMLAAHGYMRMSFADPMKVALERINPYLANGLRLRPFVDEIGWEGVKNNAPETREYLQKFGTEFGRNMLGENVWVDLAFDQAPDGAKVVFSDVRFPNELAAIQSAGGEVWRVDREGVGPANSHVSETALDNARFDRVIRNCGTLNDLQTTVDAIIASEGDSLIRV